VGVDGHRPSLEAARAKSIHHRYAQLDLRTIGDSMPARSFDAVVALDVIEHFERSEGLQLLVAMERIARKRVIVFTPNGFLPQGEFDENPWQIHRSGWTPVDFVSRGYLVHGVNGARFLRGEFAGHRVRPAALGDALSRLTQLFAFSAPSIAFQLLAIRDVTGVE